MSSQWKPGDVAMVGRYVIFCHEDIDPELPIRWTYTDGSSARVSDTHMRNARPLVVIDPEDREQVERLMDVYDNTPYSIDDGDAGVSEMQAALREFANPTPPKPEEPTGLGAVVEDEAGDAWVLDRDGNRGYLDARWLNVRTRAHRRYAEIEAVEVLSEGVTP